MNSVLFHRADNGDPVLLRDLRSFIYRTFHTQGRAPFVEDIMREFSLKDRTAVAKALWTLHEGHHVLMAPFSSAEHVLMAWPFSNIANVHRVYIPCKAGVFYANCAWDLFGIHVIMGKEYTLALTACHQTGDEIAFELEAGNFTVVDAAVVRQIIDERETNITSIKHRVLQPTQRDSTSDVSSPLQESKSGDVRTIDPQFLFMLPFRDWYKDLIMT